MATVLLAAVLLGERPRPREYFGLLLTVAGVVLIAGGEFAQLGIGTLLVSGSVVVYAIYTVGLRKLPSANPIVLAAGTCVWGLVFLLPWLLLEIGTGSARFQMTPGVVVAVVYLGVMASAGTLLLWTFGAARVPSAAAGAFTAAIPAVGYGLAVLTGEEPSGPRLAG